MTVRKKDSDEEKRPKLSWNCSYECLCRKKLRNKDNIYGVKAEARAERKKQQENLAEEVTVELKEGNFTEIFGDVCISYLVPFKVLR